MYDIVEMKLFIRVKDSFNDIYFLLWRIAKVCSFAISDDISQRTQILIGYKNHGG